VTGPLPSTGREARSAYEDDTNKTEIWRKGGALSMAGGGRNQYHTVPEVDALVEVDERSLFLSTSPVERDQQRLMLAFILVLLLGFGAAAPFARAPLPEFPAFVTVYQTALVIFDLVIAALLFGQFLILRSHALIVLACGYLFSTAMTVAHLLTFPGVFSSTGLLDAGIQTTAWLYWFWHGGFLVAMISYALLKRHDAPVRGNLGIIIPAAVLATVAAGAGLIMLATVGEQFLPSIMLDGKRVTRFIIGPSATVWIMGLLALALLRRGRQTALDLWLMAVVWAWLLDVALSTVLADARFQLGFYAGRGFGLLASALVLVALVVNINRLYARQAAVASQLGVELADMRRLHEVSTRSTHQVDLPHMLDEILDATIEVQRADFGNIQLYDPKAGTLRIVVQRGFPRAFLNYLATVNANHDSVCAQALRDRHRIIVEDVMSDDRFISIRSLAAQTGFRSVQSTPILVRDGELRGMISTHCRKPNRPSERDLRLTDLYARLAAELIERVEGDEALRKAARTAEKANRTKDRFLMTASHDLRQPLQSLSLLAGVLRRLASDERVFTVVAGQEQAIDTMSKLLNSLLDISKLETGAIEPHAIAMPLDDLFDELKVEFASPAEAKGVRFEVTRCGYRVLSDPLLLGQILRNLLSNAIRYTYEGSVTLTCVCEGELARIEIKDTGVGIAREHLSHIFEEFYQIGVSPNATREGHGLGLSVVQRAAKLLGHKIKVRSRPGKGTVFSILLPVCLEA
jgi:signal transduction histidine kinase